MDWKVFAKYFLRFIALMIFIIGVVAAIMASVMWTMVNNDISLVRASIVAGVFLLLLGAIFAYSKAKDEEFERWLKS